MVWAKEQTNDCETLCASAEKYPADLPYDFDVVTSFDNMEYWHNSKKKSFADVGKLRPGGVFVLGLQNCVNMRKRLTVPL